MRALKTTNAILGALLLAVLTGGMQGCAKDKDQTTPKNESPQTETPIISKLSGKEAACEKNIREQMATRRISVQFANELHQEFLELVKAVSSTNQTEYTISKNGEEVGAVGVQFKMINGKSMHQINYALIAPDVNSQSQFKLEMFKLDQNSLKRIDQFYSVGEDCQLTPLSSTFHQISRINEDKFSFQVKTFFADGKNESDKDEFTVPSGAILANLTPDPQTFAEIPKDFYVFLPKAGVAHGVAKVLPDKKVTQFNFELKMKVLAVDLNINDKRVVSVEHTEDENFKISADDSGASKVWKVPKNIWDSILLNTPARVDEASVAL